MGCDTGVTLSVPSEHRHMALFLGRQAVVPPSALQCGVLRASLVALLQLAVRRLPHPVNAVLSGLSSGLAPHVTTLVQTMSTVTPSDASVCCRCRRHKGGTSADSIRVCRGLSRFLTSQQG